MNINYKSREMIVDIETSYNLSPTWRTSYDYHLSSDDILRERAIICIGYKIKGTKEKGILTWDSKQNDKKMLAKFVKIYNSCDTIIGHNIDKFDIKFIRGRLAHHGLDTLVKIKTRDTLKISRSLFDLNSYKLKYLAQYFNLGGKVETGGMSLWTNLIENQDTKSLKHMLKYCMMDVILTEKLDNYLLSYTCNRHSNGPCIKCGSVDFQKRGVYTSMTGMYQRYRCNGCSSWSISPTKIK